jgi:hypothetical protein
MKGTQQTAVYLICTRNKGYQRKHVAVCKQCKFNGRCQAFVEYCRSIPAETTVETPSGIDRTRLLRHIIQELQEIKKLTYDQNLSSPEPAYVSARHRFQEDRCISEIKAALHDIKLLC